MDINNLPQLCVHLIKEYLQDVIEDQRVALRKEYLVKRMRELFGEAKHWIKGTEFTKRKIAMIREACDIDWRKEFLLERDGRWQPKGWYYQCNTGDRMYKEVLHHIREKLILCDFIENADQTIKRKKHFGEVGDEFHTKTLAGAYLLESVCQSLQQQKKKTTKK
jgi:hypothetical protein